MKLRYWSGDYRVLAGLALLAAGAVAYFGKEGVLAAGGWLLAAAVLGLLAWLLVMVVRRFRARRAGAGLDAMVAEQGEQEVASAEPASRAQAEALRERMAAAVQAIRTSRIGQARGTAALYELPWYVIIGNPAAGKSTAILNSGLRFPFEDNRSAVIHGLGGTRNCDWYFTTEGIVLDTAGRYSVSAEDRLEWLTFLDLLRKHRPRAPINGIIIAASVAELSGSKPEFAIALAKNLRQRVQELTERLEVHAPVYVMFTKADLISGFRDFFRGLDPSERENAWGATLPYAVGTHEDALAAFDRHFDELAEGLRETGLAQMAVARGRDVAPGLLTMPMEFTGIKPALRTFIATLFEENPYQFKPVFRGFYFTSALQEGVAMQPASERVSRHFGLGTAADGDATVPPADASYFLQGLFRRVIFADHGLVRQYSSRARTRLRHGAFFGAVLLLGAALAAWTWSYTGNRQLVADVAADLDEAVAMQQGSVALGSRIEALLVLQDRLEQLERYGRKRPVGLGFGLYQGAALEEKLRQEYFNGMRQVMLAPVSARLEEYLVQVVAHRTALQGPVGPVDAAGEGAGAAGPGPTAAGDGDPARLYEEASPTDSQDAYNALKAYLMLADPAKVEGVHLGDQLTRFWRGWLEANRGDMPREQMLRAAGRLMSYHVRQAGKAGWPVVEVRYGLVDDSRQALRQVMRGASARDRVYAQIKARAATRFSPVTVAGLLGDGHSGGLLTGSHQVSGAFTREAWEEYVADAIAEAAGTELSSTDWVLESTVHSDLTLAGSPEHITRELTGLYKAEYAREWQRFLQGVSVARFGDFDDAVERMNTLGDPAASPLRALLEAVNRQTVWDNPAAASALADGSRDGVVAWFNRVVMRRSPAPAAPRVELATGAGEPGGPGPIGQQFAGLARLLGAHEGGPPLLHRYFEALGTVRSRFNAIHTQGDAGPGARKLMQQTLDADGSELSAALRLVDEQMLTGLEPGEREVLRPLLLRPLVQGFSALVGPTESELNRTWAAQVQQPFEEGIGRRYPYAPDADVEAAPGDIDRIFGPSGAIARFGEEALGSLVIRRGATLTPRRWADIGISLNPELVGGYGRWVGGGASDGPRMVFQVLPLPARGRQYSLVVDGQRLLYRNTPPQWHTFQLPGDGVPGVEISAVTGDGREVQVFNAPGAGATEAMFAAAEASAVGDQHYRLAWRRDGAEVEVELRIVSAVQPNATASDSLGLRLPRQVAGSQAPATAGAGGTGVVASPAGVR